MKFFMGKTFNSLDSSFFEQPTLILARLLLGKLLVKVTDAGLSAGWIVETEAYMGAEDRAAHSFGNRRTPRTEVMFGPPGFAYIYEMHTHCLMNVVSGEINQPQAVLIRAVEPCEGIHLMYERRSKVKREIDLTNGPGKLTKALGITKQDYGRPLFELPIEQSLFIAEGKPSEHIKTGPRIGIDNSGEAKDYPWRFWIDGNKFVSKMR
jgi:DNA-3-methyladenine glycosylase